MYWWALRSQNGIETRKYKQYRGLWPLVFSRLRCYQVNTSDDEESKGAAAAANSSSKALNLQCTWHCAEDLRYRSIWNHLSFLPNLESPEYLLHLPVLHNWNQLSPTHCLVCVFVCLLVHLFTQYVYVFGAWNAHRHKENKMLTQWYKMKW